MAEAISKLIQLLGEHNQFVLRLVELAEFEVGALKENNLEQLLGIIEQQEQISAQLVMLETRRQTLERELGEQFDFKQQFAVRDVIPFLEARAAADLDQIRKSLRSNYLRFQELNSLNTSLIRQGLSYVNKMQQVLVPAGDQMYSRKGLSNQNFGQKILDKSV